MASLVAVSLFCLSLPAQSVYPSKLADAHAIYLAKGEYGATADGVADDSEALQKAINRVADTTHEGVVFLAAGRYRISRTIFLWPGVRLIGYGAQRPVITLGAHTPGFDHDPAYMLFFAGGRLTATANPGRRRPSTPFPGTVPATLTIDANPGTFYSAISNVDLEIGDGNPGAIGIRSHYAQHCFLSHMRFRLGSGLAGIDEAGNLASDLHFEGGEYGIRTGKPSPGWQFTLLDSSFNGQRQAAIREHEAGLTMVNTRIQHVPAAITIDPGYAEELWVSNSEFEDVRGPAILISNEANARTQINLRGIRCKNVPVFARLRESGRNLNGPGAQTYVVSMSHGLTLGNISDAGEIRTSFDARPGMGGAESGLKPVPVLHEPPSAEPWANAHELGAIGDGVHDDTAALQAAARQHRIVYLPSGRYRISSTLELRPDTVLFGLHPSTTQLVLEEDTPSFNGAGGPVAMLHAPPGGSTAVSGIGLFGGGTNLRVSALMWQAGETSQVNDVRFLGGHGTNGADGQRLNPYNPTHTGDPDPRKHWDSQYPSLWVLNGGGGTFADIWTPDTFAQAGMLVSNTQTPGHVYELSSEHHVRNEVEFQHASHWEIMALQTEEEWGESGHALPVSIRASEDLLFTNFHSYRVVGSRDTLPEVVQVASSRDIHFRNAHIDSDSRVSTNNGVSDVDADQSERFREFSNLDVTTAASASSGPPQGDVKRLSTGFYNISGAAVDATGRLLFVDTRMQRIYRWSPALNKVELLRDAPWSVTNLAVAKNGDVLAIAYDGNGTVYNFNPETPSDQVRMLQPEDRAPREGATFWVANDFWNLRSLRADPGTAHKPFQYTSPDGSVVLPAGADFVNGELYYGTKMADLLRSFTITPVSAGSRVYVTEEEENRTWVGQVDGSGTMSSLKLFAERGGEGVTTDQEGNVYIAAGDIFRYSADGKLLGVLHVPERPISLAFGGPLHRTLFILARTSLYAWQTP